MQPILSLVHLPSSRLLVQWITYTSVLHPDKNLSGAAKDSAIKGLLNSITISGRLDNPLVEVEYKGRQSNVILTTQGESTLKIFGE